MDSIVVTPKKGYLKVDIQVAAPINSITQAQIEKVQTDLAQKIGKDIYLNVEVIPLKRLVAPNK
ncbi:hypothetical protein C7B62_05365 [Pleurocapsa sp. CCALA 161]|uniref:hypothetical protein n=1 Tax=Pleurocapsa sp. CCALA 161 TaxID=2107688 RepID=UPI000D075BC0|nr:hypothetical protein [Pleurocapsa sp. CCALA 161]PSB11561.1 hypothetical protein C7B62_05365 [Pleurocapsa sp. CCALA 161]